MVRNPVGKGSLGRSRDLATNGSVKQKCILDVGVRIGFNWFSAG
jgi:hypothetical protein